MVVPCRNRSSSASAFAWSSARSRNPSTRPTTARSPTYDIGTPQDDNIHAWSGTAAAAYRQKQAAQKSAADKASESAAVISKWLYDVGKRNVDYATEIVKLLAEIGLQLVKVTVNAATVINVQFSINDLAEFVRLTVRGDPLGPDGRLSYDDASQRVFGTGFRAVDTSCVTWIRDQLS